MKSYLVIPKNLWILYIMSKNMESMDGTTDVKGIVVDFPFLQIHNEKKDERYHKESLLTFLLNFFFAYERYVFDHLS